MDNDEIAQTLAALTERTENLLRALDDRGVQIAVLRSVVRALIENHSAPDKVQASFQRITDEQLTAILQELSTLEAPLALRRQQQAVYRQQINRWMLELFQPRTPNEQRYLPRLVVREKKQTL